MSLMLKKAYGKIFAIRKSAKVKIIGPPNPAIKIAPKKTPTKKPRNQKRINPKLKKTTRKTTRRKKNYQTKKKNHTTDI